MKLALALPPLALWMALGSAGGAWVRVVNEFGDITVRGEPGAAKASYKGTPFARRARPDDVKYTEEDGVVRIECRPADRARVDLDVTVPHASMVEVSSKTGWVTIRGLIRDVSVVTETSPLRLVVPWRLTRIRMLSVTVPPVLKLPQLDYAEFPAGIRQGYWTLVDAPPGFTANAANPKDPLRTVPDLDQGMPLRGWLYGSLRLRGTRLQRIELEDQPLTPDSWIKLPDTAPEALERMSSPGGGPAAPPPAGGTDAGPGDPAGGEPLPRFVSRVQMVNLVGPVYDQLGRPIPGLRPEDFEIIEEGEPQKAAVATSEEAPFNLVLVLDFSTTALRARSVLEQVVRGFLEIARPQDRTAVYAVADSLFQVISPLTTDRSELLERIRAMPQPGGTSPIYDALALAYAQEGLPGLRERTAIVLVSDGIDNSLHSAAGGSKTGYETLLRFASGMPVLVYPIVLPPPSARRPLAASPAVIDAAPEARRRLQQLADATGGRLFTADSTFDMQPVYPLVAQELERVYQVAYYPRRKELDGRWRRVEVLVKRSGVSFRTRSGYYAK